MAAAASPSSCGGAPETSIPPGVSMCGRDRWGSSTAKKKKEKKKRSMGTFDGNKIYKKL